jgi:hypothetical protein
MLLTAQCHCGAVEVEVGSTPPWVLECRCSICRKLGVLWAYHPPGEVRISGRTDTYVCNNRVIEFHRCRTCGCTTHWATLGTDYGRMGVNARLFDPDVLSAIELRSVPGPSPAVFKDDWQAS